MAVWLHKSPSGDGPGTGALQFRDSGNTRAHAPRPWPRGFRPHHKASAKSAGSKLKRGRPRSTPRVQKRDLNHLIEFSCSNADSFSENTLQFLHEVYTQFGLTPRQYLQWVAKTIRRGKCMMRRCLLCGKEFPSMSAGDRHCPSCKAGRNRLLKNDGA
jgi:hypothetical protein